MNIKALDTYNNNMNMKMITKFNIIAKMVNNNNNPNLLYQLGLYIYSRY